MELFICLVYEKPVVYNYNLFILIIYNFIKLKKKKYEEHKQKNFFIEMSIHWQAFVVWRYDLSLSY